MKLSELYQMGNVANPVSVRRPKVEILKTVPGTRRRGGNSMMVTPHFHVDEFAQPARHGFPRMPYPPEWIEDRLRPLCEALEVIRAEFSDRRITIISGYRTPLYNAKVGGEPKSQHMEGRAADFWIQGVDPFSAYAICLRLHALGRLKIGGLGKYPGFSHIDVRVNQQGALVSRLAKWDGARTAKKTEGLG